MPDVATSEMAQTAPQTAPEPAPETAEAAFRRVASRKLLERGYPPDQIDQKVTQLMQKGLGLRLDTAELLRF